MRVTQRMMVENAIQYMNDNLDKINTLQKQTSTGKAFQYASDSPSAAATALTLRSTLKINQSYLNTSQLAGDWMSATDSALQSAVKLAKNAITLANKGISDTQGSDERNTLANEMDYLLQQAVDIGNTSHLGDFIFSGFQTKTVPFTLGKADPTDPTALYDHVDFNGDQGVMLRNTGPSQTISQNIDGDNTFMPLFNAIINARDALKTGDTTQIQNAAGQLENALEPIKNATTLNGARQRQMNQMTDRLTTTNTELTSLLSEKENVNMTEAISLYQNQQTVYQTVLEVSTRTLSALSLFNMLS